MKLLFCILLVVACAACDDDSNIERNSIEYFEAFLKKEMKYSDLSLIFGKPDSDIGSGIHIYVYKLSDGTRVVIGYTDQIIYARHVNENEVLSELI
jgi:hypothetical protein